MVPLMWLDALRRVLANQQKRLKRPEPPETLLAAVRGLGEGYADVTQEMLNTLDMDRTVALALSTGGGADGSRNCRSDGGDREWVASG
ncbi:MAG: hypothetical protein R2857_13010 [Vampirovibrionales bacterium]